MVRFLATICLFAIGIISFAQPASNKKLTSTADYFFAGEETHEKGNDLEAIRFYDECLRIKASYKDAYRSRAVAEEALENLEAALRDYTLYLELEMDDPSEALFSRAVLHFRLAHYEPAKEDFIKLLDFPSGATTTIFFRQDAFTEGADKIFTTQGSYKSILYDYLGQIETKLKDYPAAIAYFDKAIRQNSQDTNVWLHRGLAKEKAGDIEGAALDYQKALSIDPQLSLAQYNLAQLKGKKGESDQAKAFIDKAIENNHKLPYSYAQRAQFKMSKGDVKGALSDYDSAIITNPNDPSYWLNRGMVKDKLKDFTGANDDFTRAIKLKEDFDKAWFARANLCAKLNKLPAAIDDYTIAIYHNAAYKSAYYNRGLAYQRMNKLKEACEDFVMAESMGMAVDVALKANCK